MNVVGTSAVVYADGNAEIVRVVTGHAYARNGNRHNPTPRFRWDVYYAGKRVGSRLSGKAARELLREAQVTA